MCPSMSVVKSIELVVPRDVYHSGSEVDGQLVLSLHSTLINPLLKVELIGRGYLEWMEEANAHKDYSQASSCVNRADYVHKTKTFNIQGERGGIHLVWSIMVMWKEAQQLQMTHPPMKCGLHL